MPPKRFGVGLFDTLCPLVHETQVKLRRDVTLFSGQTVPFSGRSVVQTDASTLVMHDRKIELGIGMALFRSLAVQGRCFNITLQHTKAELIHIPKRSLRRCVTLFGKRTPNLHRCCKVAGFSCGHPSVEILRNSANPSY